MCCIPNQRHREAEREKCYFWRILWRFRGESDIPAESWLMSGSWPSIEIEESLRRETWICKDCKCEGTQHGVVFGAHGEVLEPEMWTGEGSLWKSYSVFGLCSVAGLSAVNTQVFRWRTNSASALGWPFQYSASQSVRTTRNSLPQEPDEKSKFSSPTPAFRIRNSSHGIWESVCCVTAPSLSWRTLKFRNHCSGTSMGDAVGKYRLKLNRLLQIAQPWKKKKSQRHECGQSRMYERGLGETLHLAGDKQRTSGAPVVKFHWFPTFSGCFSKPVPSRSHSWLIKQNWHPVQGSSFSAAPVSSWHFAVVFFPGIVHLAEVGQLLALWGSFC